MNIIKKRMELKFDKTTHYKLKYITKNKSITMSNLITNIINEYIKSYESKNGEIKSKNN